LLALQLKHQEERYASLMGSTAQVLIEGPSKSNPERLSGRSIGNLNIHVDRAGNDQHIGNIVPVQLTSHTQLSLFGTVRADG
jgi:tRNA-2-methylthio-N6-dimethylallyladenosine synthase